MRKQPLDRKIVIIVIFAMALSFFLGNKLAYYQMYREEVAHRELLSLAMSAPADEQALNDTPLNNELSEPAGAEEQADAAATSAWPAPVEPDHQPTAETAPKSGLVNINTADKAELIALPGIGEVKAQAIIDYREKHGSFLSTEELMNINGIGEKTYANLKDLICV